MTGFEKEQGHKRGITKVTTPFKLNLVKRTSKELKQSRCKAYKYLIP